ncbi:glycosyltransferase [Rhodopirellula europaea]|uniref:Glycosyl transferase, group 1 n=1 Tax=Rhodopirellula europaea 6C TaxID=1263867 RepID=M2B1M9_9BACT|nr:glycosyltransferase [Rhodopirellula europaea]EMB15688.1 glycosyl transferase, group 1 [Rhodopirellula europaea 6C]
MTEIEHVIFVTDHAYINGGVAKVATDEAKGIAKTGRRVTFFAPCGPPDPTLAEAGVEVVCLNQPDIADDSERFSAMRRGIWNKTAARSLTEVIGNADPARSVLHCHGFSRGLSPSVGPLLTSGQIPHVLTMHEYFLACPNGGFYDYQRQEICTRRALGADCLFTNCDARRPSHKLWRVARHVIMKSAGRLPRCLRDVIYLSRTQLDVIKTYIPTNVRLHHLPNPIKSTPNAPRIRAEDNDIFLYVGRLSPEKGCVDFARAAKTAGVRAVFLGTGPEREKIQAVNPEATMAGWASPQEIADWMSRSRALVFPSLWYETFGLVAFEAMAKGLPVIVGAWNAAAENIEPDINGIIYRHRNDLSIALRKARTKHIGALSKSAYNKRSEYGLSIDQHLDALFEIYHQTKLPV